MNEIGPHGMIPNADRAESRSRPVEPQIAHVADTDLDTLYPIVYLGRMCTIDHVYGWSRLGQVSLREIGTNYIVIVSAADVPRRLYVIMMDGRGVMAEPLKMGKSFATFTWNEAQAWLKDLQANPHNKDILFTIEVLR